MYKKRVLGENRVTRGVITGIPIDEDLDKLQQTIHGCEVRRLRRLMRTNGEKVDSMSVLVAFHSSVLPEKIRVYICATPLGFMFFLVLSVL